MKKLIKVSFFLAVLLITVPVYAEGDMSTGTKTCTQTCGNFNDDSGTTTNISGKTESEESTVVEIYSWVHKQIFELIGS